MTFSRIFYALAFFMVLSAAGMELAQEDIQKNFLQAVRTNNIGHATFYLNRGANIHVHDAEGKTAVDYLALLEDECAPMRELFMQKYPDLIIPESTGEAWGVSSFLVSQISGAREVLAFGRSAALALGSHLTGSVGADSNYLLESDMAFSDRLVHLFLEHPEAFKRLVNPLPRDINKSLARLILHNHPLKNGKKGFLAKIEALCQLHTLRGHTAKVNLARLNPAGDKVVTASDDTTARIWDANSGECLHTLMGHTKQVYLVKFNPADDKVVSASLDYKVMVWCVASGKCLHILRGHTRKVNTVKFNTTGEIIATASDDRTARIWNISSGECLHILQGHTSEVNTANFNSVCDKIVTASNDHKAMVWDVDAGTCLHILRGHIFRVLSAQFRADDNVVTVLWCIGKGEVVKVWDASSGCDLQSELEPAVCLKAARINNKSKFITVTDEGAVKIWDRSRLVALTNWLERGCSFEQALLLICIYEARVNYKIQRRHALLKKHNPLFQFLHDFTSFVSYPLRFDFNTCPHLQVYYESMPDAIKTLLEPAIIKSKKRHTP